MVDSRSVFLGTGNEVNEGKEKSIYCWYFVIQNPPIGGYCMVRGGVVDGRGTLSGTCFTP